MSILRPVLLLKKVLQLTVAASLILSLQACAVVAVADAAVTVVATGVKVTAKAVGAVANAIIPDGDDD
nr:NF038104 family lipoprotein [Rhodoferax sp.]